MKSYIVTRNVSLWKTWGPLGGSVNFVGVEITVKLKIAQRQTQFHWIRIPTTTEKDITVRLQDQAYITWSVLWSLTAVNMYFNNTYENIVRTPFICGKKLNFFKKLLTRGPHVLYFTKVIGMIVCQSVKN